MTGEIVSSNADQVNGDTGIWFFRNTVNEVWATSNVPANDPDENFLFGLNQENNPNAESTPLHPFAIFCGICAAVGLFLRRCS
jgi:hypothetical protein